VIADRLRLALMRVGVQYVRHSPISFKKAGVYNRLLEPALIRHLQPTETRTEHGTRIRVSGEDLIQRYLFAFGIWEPALTSFVKSRLRPGDTFVDVGANIGYYTLLASRLVNPGGGVVSIEASPSIFQQLSANVTTNEASNARLVNVAASAGSGEVGVFRAKDSNIGATSLTASDDRTFEASVRSEPLSSILTSDELGSARLIKIDVEGHELSVLEGLYPVLDDVSPELEIMVELSSAALDRAGTTMAAFLARWHELGYFPYRFDSRYESWIYVDKAHRAELERVSPTEPLDGTIDLALSRRHADMLR
jgi:FkbM family methyltransferase